MSVINNLKKLNNLNHKQKDIVWYVSFIVGLVFSFPLTCWLLTFSGNDWLYCLGVMMLSLVVTTIYTIAYGIRKGANFQDSEWIENNKKEAKKINNVTLVITAIIYVYFCGIAGASVMILLTIISEHFINNVGKINRIKEVLEN